jgi:voltage-gated potassium channel Kch
VVAIDDPEKALAAARVAREHFPNLRIVARARARTDAYEYAEMGIPAVRETFGSALDAAEQALVQLGRTPEEARRASQEFRRYDEERLVRSLPFRKDVDRLIAFSQQERDNLERLLTEESAGS